MGASVSASKVDSKPGECRADASAECRASEEKPPEPFWERTITDPVAAYTGVLAVLTGILASVSVVQIRFLTRADKLAAKTASNAELAMVSSQRAYLFAEGYKALSETPKGKKGRHWRFRPVWRNSGDTPPNNTVIFTECVVTGPEGLAADYAWPALEKDVGTGVISAKGTSLGGQAPKQIPDGPNTAISPQTVAQVQKGEKIIYLWGWAAYNDVFPSTRRHLTHFCWVCTAFGNPHAADLDALRWDYTQHTRGNYFSDLS